MRAQGKLHMQHRQLDRTVRWHSSRMCRDSEGTETLGRAAHLGLLGGDVARPADAVRQAEVALRDQAAGDARLPLAHADIAGEVVAVHQRGVLQEMPRFTCLVVEDLGLHKGL